ncbi:flagellar basal body P-ring protein FlgI [Gynuella sp.]|uniref:flagellar basal body P-ring protein FlgI n=1 Tax=Gynuella sp. TaxID=2969146 RepID=UPI003D0DD1F4
MVVLNLFRHSVLMLLLVSSFATVAAGSDSVRIKDLARIKGVRDNSLVGYGIVAGLAGTGDSIRNQATVQSISNTLRKFDIMISSSDVRSRNVAAVMLTANLPAFAEAGDSIDVNVTSIGDARSLAGGTLLLADLRGPDQNIYALAQGPLSVGGYNYDVNGNIAQKNHPTAAIAIGGGRVEQSVETQMLNAAGELELLLDNPDITTAIRLVDSINAEIGANTAYAENPGKVAIRIPAEQSRNYLRLMARVENIQVIPDSVARVVVNEKTGTVISGGDVRIGKVSITHDDIKISVSNETRAYSSLALINTQDKGVTLVPDSKLTVEEQPNIQMDVNQGSSVADLIVALRKVNATSREIITILQTLKSAGALHAELIVQ